MHKKESAVGDLVTAAQLDIAKKSGYPDVDFAFTNNGGIRADLVVKPDGTVTWGCSSSSTTIWKYPPSSRNHWGPNLQSFGPTI